MKNKKANKLLILLLVLGLGLAVFGGIKLTKVFTATFGRKDVAEGVEEKDLTEVINDMYITVLDDQANVVATTNPNTEVSPDYVFTENTEPVKKVKFDGKYILLLEVNDTNSLTGKTLLEDNTIYNMMLPDYMVSYEGFDQDIEESCYNFFSENAVTACGGIYSDNILKMKFANTTDKYDITFNYQFFITFAEGLKDTDFDIKTFNFGKYGSLQLYFEEAYPVISPTYHTGEDYQLTVNKVGSTSNTNNYTNWEVTLNDVKPVGHFNGHIDLALSDNMGIVVDNRTAYENIDVFVGGTKLSKKYTDGFNGCFYNDTNECLISLTVTEDTNVFAESGTRQGGLLKTLVFELGEDLDLGNIKIQFNTKAFNTYNGSSSNTAFSVNATYSDREDTYAIYSSVKSVINYYSNPSLTYDVVPSTESNATGEVANSLTYTYTLSPGTKNYAIMEIDPSYNNTIGSYYYLNSKGFLTSSEDTTDSFTIKINDTDVEFKRIDNINLSSLTNEQLTKVDPALQRQMTVIDSYSENRSGNYRNILRSTTTNEDGDYYWLVISKDTISIANNNSDNTNLYDNTGSGNELGTPAKWKIYVFNINNAKVEVSWTQYLEKINLYQTDNSNRELRSRVHLNSSQYNSAYYYRYLSNPLIIHTEQLNEFIKWDVILDSNLIKLDSDNIDNFNLSLFLPYEQTIVSGYYYDVETNKMVSERDDAKEQYASNIIVMCDQENNNKINQCAHYTKFGDLESTFASGASSYFSFGYYYHSYNIDGRNVEVDNDGLVHLVLFTKSDYNYMSQQYYDVNNAYLQVTLDAPTNKYDGESGFEAHNKLRYRLATTTGLPYVYYEMYVDDEGQTSGNSFESRDRYFNGKVNLYNDFGGYVWGYDDSYEYTSNCGNDLTSIRNCYGKILFNGTYRAYIGYEYDAIPTQMTSLTVKVDEGFSTAKVIELSTLTFTDGLLHYCDGDTGICIDIEDINKDGMKSGYFVDVSGLEDAKTLSLKYNEYVDTYTLLTNNYGATTYDSYLYGEPFRWGNTYEYNYSNIERSIYAVADIAVESSASSYTPITGGLSVDMEDIAKSYKSNTDYIELNGYLKKVRNVSLKNVNGTNIPIADIKPYMSIENMTITALDNSTTWHDIYENGEFLDGWTDSTITFLGDEDDLYNLHLVSSSGEIEPIEIYVTYKIVISLDVRNADFYEGEKIGINTNTRAAKEFTCDTCTESESDGYGNGYDATKQELYAHAYTDQSAIVRFFSGSTIRKTANADSNGIRYYTINYTAGNAGKDGPADMEVEDTVSVSDNFSYYSSYQIFKDLRSLYPKYSSYKDVTLHYGDENIALPLESGTFTVKGETGTITYDPDTLKFDVQMPVEAYGDTMSITYNIETDYNSLYAEAIGNGWLNSSGKVTGWTSYSVYQYYVSNTAKDDNTDETSYSNGGSYIKITDVVPLIAKNNTVISREERQWNIVFNTGKDNSNIKIQDSMTIEENGKEEFFAALKNKDLVIKVNNSVIYQNGTFTSGWDGTVEIHPSGLNQEFIFKDTDTKTWLANNATVSITYNTYLDYSLLGADTRVVNFHLNNNVTLNKGINNDSVLSVAYFNYEYGYNISKVYLGNGEDLSETNWKINVASDKKKIGNINLTDTNTLGDEFGDYLSLTKFKLVMVNLNTNESTVLYNTEDNTNNLNGITLGMSGDDVPGLKLGTNGKYNFFANIEELPADTRLEIYYTLKIDKGAYIQADKPLDKELVFNNRVQDNNNKYATAIGSGKIPSELAKRYVSLGKDSDGYEVIRWTIDVNLADYYDVSTLVDKDVTITDEISNVFGLDPGTVTIRKLTITPSGRIAGALVNSEYYELSTGDNTVKVKLKNPVETPAIQITFDTRVIGSTHSVHNSVELNVDNHSTKVKVEEPVNIFSPQVFGVVYSRDMLSYTIYARKLVDNEVSDKVFSFKITEIDADGNPVENGYTATSTNGDEGRIEFNGLRYSRVGTYYYKVEEVIDEDDKEYEYDKNTYIVKVVVIGNDDNTSYVVESAEVLGADEIVFNNKTPQTDTSSQNEPKNPNTAVFVGTIIAILLLGSFIFFTKFYKKVKFMK